MPFFPPEWPRDNGHLWNKRGDLPHRATRRDAASTRPRLDRTSRCCMHCTARPCPPAHGDRAAIRRERHGVSSPSVPSPIGTLKTVWSFPSGRDHTRAVLSSEAVTTNRFCASVAMRQEWGRMSVGIESQQRLCRQAVLCQDRIRKECY